MKDSIAFKIIMYILLGISAVLSVLFFMESISEGVFLNWSYILLGIASLTAIVFPIINIIQNPKKAKMVIAGVVGLAVIFGISYAMASGYEVKLGEDNVIPAETVKMVDAGLIMTYILGALSIAAAIFDGVSKMFK
jgi:inner membrane protein involved in colicin E2 resistance